MKRLLTFVLMFMIASALLAGISYGAGEERFIFSDLTVKDKKTGLVWTREANIAGKEMTWYNALKFIEKLNNQKYAGYSDWKLPSEEELVTLIDYAKGKGYKRGFHQVLKKVGFRNVQAFNYWSSSTYAGSTTNAWFVDMYDGSVGAGDEAGTVYVWPVRAGQ